MWKISAWDSAKLLSASVDSTDLGGPMIGSGRRQLPVFMYFRSCHNCHTFPWELWLNNRVDTLDYEIKLRFLLWPDILLSPLNPLHLEAQGLQRALCCVNLLARPWVLLHISHSLPDWAAGSLPRMNKWGHPVLWTRTKRAIFGWVVQKAWICIMLST